MSTRKIKDAKDLSTNELIYFKGHAQATYMSDGRTVEEAVNNMSGGSGEDSDVFILDLFGISNEYPDNPTNTGVIEFDVDSEFISMIYNAIQKNKLVIRVDYVDLYNLEIDAYSSSFLLINSHFDYGGSYVHLYMSINPSELHGSFSISTVNTGSGGTIDTSNFATKTELAQKQDILVSGTNIKTINGTTILGSGDITISSGSSTTPMRYITPAANIPIPMNTTKVITSVTSTNQTFTLATGLVISNPASITQEQKWEIVFGISTSLSNAPTITFNTGNVATIHWINGVAPTFKVGKFYEVSFLNVGGIFLGVCAEFSVS